MLLGERFIYRGISTDYGVIGNGDVAEDYCARTDVAIITDYRCFGIACARPDVCGAVQSAERTHLYIAVYDDSAVVRQRQPRAKHIVRNGIAQFHRQLAEAKFLHNATRPIEQRRIVGEILNFAQPYQETILWIKKEFYPPPLSI